MDDIRTLKLLGGWLCLDFANSAEIENGEITLEYLHTYDDLLLWSQRAGVLDDAQAGHLQRIAAKQPMNAQATLSQALTLRAVIYGVFSAIASDETPQSEDLEALNAAFTESMSHLCIVPTYTGYVITWNDYLDLALPLWAIGRSAGELLTSPDLRQLRQCAADDCSYLFLDTSRNHSRRWCDMEDCGNRAKAKRYYRRVKSS
jgi:predicted RNA-binding Zn ribbon-like protein